MTLITSRFLVQYNTETRATSFAHFNEGVRNADLLIVTELWAKELRENMEQEFRDDRGFSSNTHFE
jgi:hypothetical protein